MLSFSFSIVIFDFELLEMIFRQILGINTSSVYITIKLFQSHLLEGSRF